MSNQANRNIKTRQAKIENIIDHEHNQELTSLGSLTRLSIATQNIRQANETLKFKIHALQTNIETILTKLEKRVS